MVMQNKSIVGFEEAENMTATLARLMNAIVLLNDFYNEPGAINNVLMEAVDVQEKLLFDSVNKVNARDVVHAIKLLDSLAAKKIRSSFDLLARKKVNPAFRDDLFLSETRYKKIKFPINDSPLNFSHFFPTIKIMKTDMDKLITELNLSVPNTEMINSYVKTLFSSFESYETELLKIKKIFEDDLNIFAESLENISSFTLFIEDYQQLTEQIFSKSFQDSLKSLQSSGKTIKNIFASYDIKHIKHKIQNIFKLISTKVQAKYREYLIGFPRGSQDIEMLFNDFDKEWLKKLLNRGKSLYELKPFLSPLREIKKVIAKAEKVWYPLDRNTYSSLTFRSATNLRNMEEFSVTSTLKSLTIVQSYLRDLKPIADLNSATLNNFKTLLSSSQAFKNFFIEFEALVEITETQEKKPVLELKQLWTSSKNKQERIDLLKNSSLSGRIYSMIQSISSQVFLLNRKSDELSHLLVQSSEFKTFFTDELYSKMRKIVQFPQEFESQLLDINNFSDLLKSMSPMTQKEREKVKKLPDFLLSGKQKFDKLLKTANNIKTEVIEPKGFNCLSQVWNPPGIAIQLALTQHALAVVRKRDLHQSIQTFLSSGMELAKKINTSQPEVRAATDYEWERFFYFNETMETFFSEIKDLPSNFSFEKQNLESFGLALSHLDNVHFPNIPFHRIAESLIDLKSTVIGKSREISSVEESFEKLRDLQYAVIRKEKVLSTKLQQADLFYHCYFVGKKEYQSTWEIVPMILVTIGGLIASIFSSFVAWVLHTLQNRNRYQEQIDLGRQLIMK